MSLVECRPGCQAVGNKSTSSFPVFPSPLSSLSSFPLLVFPASLIILWSSLLPSFFGLTGLGLACANLLFILEHYLCLRCFLMLSRGTHTWSVYGSASSHIRVLRDEGLFLELSSSRPFVGARCPAFGPGSFLPHSQLGVGAWPKRGRRAISSRPSGTHLALGPEFRGMARPSRRPQTEIVAFLSQGALTFRPV